MFGASIYYHIEHSEEKVQRADNLKKRIKITGKYKYNYLTITEWQWLKYINDC